MIGEYYGNEELSGTAGFNYITVQTSDEGYEYNIYDKTSFVLIDGGFVENTDLSIQEVLNHVAIEHDCVCLESSVRVHTENEHDLLQEKIAYSCAYAIG